MRCCEVTRVQVPEIQMCSNWLRLAKLVKLLFTLKLKLKIHLKHILECVATLSRAEELKDFIC